MIARHVPPVVIRRRRHERTATFERLAPNGPVVGLLPEATFTQDSTDLGPGDIVLAFTDGVSDMVEDAGHVLADWLCHIGADDPDATAAQLRDRVFDGLRQLTAGRLADDDRTLVVVKVRN